MKLTSKIIGLLLDLNAIETEDNKSLLIGDGFFLRKNLLELYQRTDKPKSHDLIIQIMAEGGYPWFGKVAKIATELGVDELVPSNSESLINADVDLVMSEDDFLDLLPINEHFH